MREFLFLFMGLLGCLHLSAQEFGTHWISCPMANDTSQVWFRGTYLTPNRPAHAHITIASTGRFQLFVNERNVSRNVLLPAPSEQGCIQTITFDITSILRSDTNTIAVWYAPNPALPSDKQLSLSYYGILADGSIFAHQAGEGWFCRKACGSIDGKGERIDATAYDPSWKACTTNLSGWESPIGASDPRSYPLLDKKPLFTGYRIAKILSPEEIYSDTHSVTYRFPRRFQGWVRLTLREAQPGEVLHVNGLTYICSGKMDEQACRRFTITTQHDLVIQGDEAFNKDQIHQIEGMEILPNTPTSFE